MAKQKSRAVATGTVEITVPLSRLARSLGQARTVVAASMRRIGRVIVGAMTRAWTMAAASVRIFTAGLRRLRTVMASLLGPVVTILAPLAGLAGLGLAVKAWASFEQAMANVGAIAGTTQKELEMLSAEARRLGRTTAFSAVDAANAMESFALAGFSVDEMMRAMEPTLNLAAAGTLDMATASDIVAKTMRGMGLDAEELTRAVDVMTNAFTTSNTNLQMLGDAFKYVGPVGKAAGKSLEELTAAIQIMSDAGIQGGQAGAALRNILLRLQAQPMEVKKVLDKLGVSIGDESGRMKHLGDIVDELRDKMARLTPIQRAAYLSQLAGTRAASAMNTLMAAGGDLLKEKENLLKREGTAAEIAAKKLATLSGQFKILWSVVQEAAISLGKVLAPAVGKVVESLQNALPMFGRTVEQIKPLVDWVGDQLADSFTRAAKFVEKNMAVFRRWGWELTQIFSNVTAGLSRVFSWFAKLFGVEKEGLGQGLVGLLDQVIGMVAVLTTKPQQTMAAMGENIKAAFWTGIAGLENVFSWFWRMGYTWGEWFFRAATNQLMTAIGRVPEQKEFNEAAAALERFWGEVRFGLNLGAETASGKKAAAAKERARRTWDKAKAEAAEQRRLMGAGGVFPMAPKLGTKEEPEEKNPWWNEPTRFPSEYPVERFPSARAQRLADYEVRKNQLAEQMAQARAARDQMFRQSRRRAGYNDPERLAARREAANERIRQRLWARMESGDIDTAEYADLIAKVGGKRALPAGGGPGVPAEQAIAKAAKKGKGGGEMMGLEQYLAQLQAGLSKKDKADAIEQNTGDIADNTGNDGPIVKELVAIKNKKSVAGFA